MSRNAARPLCRALTIAIAATILCGCGEATPDIITPSGERKLLLQPDRLNSPVEIVSTPIEQRPVVLAGYPVEPLPAIVRTDHAAATRPAEAPDDAPAILDSRPALEPIARSPRNSDFDSAYAVSPRRSVNPDDRLAPLTGPSDPTPELIAVARQADSHVGRGFRLAERGALFTARAELRRALALSAAALDEQRNTVAHSRALNNGLRALSEAEDFVPVVRSTGRATRSIETIIQSHQTPILHGEPTDELDASRAIERYLSYAQEQLAAAAGDLQPAASALYALGKLEMSVATDIGSLESARAAVYLQAALIVNPQHALAANELGVLLARHGRLAEAKAALSHTLRIASLPSAWRNLSIVHHGLGEMQLAGQADQQWRQAASAQSQTGTASQGATAVQWVDPATFAQSTQASTDMPVPSKVNQPAVARAVAPGDVNGGESGKSASSWFPWPRKSR
jgi:tetratricopeptide (TPR) repeat protein